MNIRIDRQADWHTDGQRQSDSHTLAFRQTGRLADRHNIWIKRRTHGGSSKRIKTDGWTCRWMGRPRHKQSRHHQDRHACAMDEQTNAQTFTLRMTLCPSMHAIVYLYIGATTCTRRRQGRAEKIAKRHGIRRAVFVDQSLWDPMLGQSSLYWCLILTVSFTNCLYSGLLSCEDRKTMTYSYYGLQDPKYETYSGENYCITNRVELVGNWYIIIICVLLITGW